MQVNIFSTPIQSFKGSFKIRDLDAFVDDFEEPSEKKTKSLVIVEKPKAKPEGLMIKTTGCIDKNGAVTAILMSPNIQGECKKSLTPTLLNLCKFHDVNPDSDLFMVSGLDPLQRRYIMFNSFYKDEKTGIDCVQVFYTSSEDSNLTEIQKDIVQIFNDKRNSYYLSQGSTKNPFAKATCHGVMLGSVFEPTIAGFKSISKPMNNDEILHEDNKVYPIIYSQTPNGIYTRYKVITLYR